MCLQVLRSRKLTELKVTKPGLPQREMTMAERTRRRCGHRDFSSRVEERPSTVCFQWPHSSFSGLSRVASVVDLGTTWPQQPVGLT